MLVAGSCRQCVLSCLADLHRPARLLQLTSCVLKACPCLQNAVPRLRSGSLLPGAAGGPAPCMARPCCCPGNSTC